MSENKSESDYQILNGISPDILFEKLLDIIDSGVKTDDLRKNPIKYLVKGTTKEIVVCTGGEGLKVSREIITEMAKRGDQLAIKLLEKNKFSVIPNSFTNSGQQWCYLESGYHNYDRENKILIEILKEGKLDNIGGWTLEVYTVYTEPWSYEVCKSDDHWGSEYVKGYISVHE